MQVNLSTSERWVRAVIGLIAVFLGTISAAGAPWATFSWVGGGALVLTAAAGYCPIYDLLGWDGTEERSGNRHDGNGDRWGGTGA